MTPAAGLAYLHQRSPFLFLFLNSPPLLVTDGPRSIGDDAEIDFGPLSSAGLGAGMAAGARIYGQHSGSVVGTRAAEL